MFKVLTSFSKAIGPVGSNSCKCFQGNFHTYRFLSIPRLCGTPLLTRSTERSRVQYSSNSSTAVRWCHASPSQLTPKEKLKKAAKEYGSVLIAFHVGISLISLGTVYFFISNGVDVQQWIGWMGMSNADESTKIVAGASQFIIAYAIHKSLAPVRISITLVSVPLIVRYLRTKGIMKSK